MKERGIPLDSGNFIKWFSEINKNTKGVGLKANYLGEAYNHEMLSRKIKIPAGFVIQDDAIKEFLNPIILEIKNFIEIHKDVDEIFTFCEKIKDRIMRLELSDDLFNEIIEAYETLCMDESHMKNELVKSMLSNPVELTFVAVRSSNDNGDSYFNVKGNSDLIYYIKKSIASLFNSKEFIKECLEYNFERFSSPLIIQKMVLADKSGHLDSKDVFVVDSIWGFGSGLKLKEINKDKYIIRRDSKVIEKNIVEKKCAVVSNLEGLFKLVELKENYSFAQTLNEAELQELNDISLRFENIFNEKIQFDFSVCNDEIFIVTILPASKYLTKNLESLNESVFIEDNNLLSSNFLPEKITKTKINLFVDSLKSSENAKFTMIKKAGLIKFEKFVKENNLSPEWYLKNFNVKEYEEFIFNVLNKLSKNFEEVWISLSDFSLIDFEDEINFKGKNPMMGLNGIKYLLYRTELLKAEINAIRRIENKKVGILIPKISSTYELQKIKEMTNGIKVGLLLEVPASLQLIKEFGEIGIDELIFCGDNLSQYLLAIDKNNVYANKFYDEMSSALLYQIEYVIRVAKRFGIKTSFFGDALNNEKMIKFLVEKGIDAVIIKPEKVREISKIIDSIEDKIIKGTDKEIRNYELNKEKERQRTEFSKFNNFENKKINTSKDEQKNVGQDREKNMNSTDKKLQSENIGEIYEMKEKETDKFDDSIEVEFFDEANCALGDNDIFTDGDSFDEEPEFNEENIHKKDFE